MSLLCSQLNRVIRPQHYISLQKMELIGKLESRDFIYLPLGTRGIFYCMENRICLNWRIGSNFA